MDARHILTLLISTSLFACQSSSKDAVTAEQGRRSYTAPGKVTVTAEEARRIAEEAYIFGYPLVLMDVTKDVMTNVPGVSERAAPLGQFVHKESFPDANFSEVVSPNADTLYSSAWLDLKKEPIILSLPATNERYFLMPMMSAWTEVFASPGSRTTGTEKGDFAVVGPDWKGTLPQGIKEVRSPTNDVWIIGRTQTNGTTDYAAVRNLQKQYHLTPLSSWGTNYVPPTNVSVRSNIDMRTPPVEQVERMSAAEFFKRMASSMKRNSPTAADGATISELVKIGLVPGYDFDAGKLPSNISKAIEEGAKSGLSLIQKSAQKPEDKRVNGWVIENGLGKYNRNYVKRSTTAINALGANLPDDAVYARTNVDSDGRPLRGDSKYTITFAKNQIPPVNAFWSLTMYNSRYFFAKNPLNRYAIGDRDDLAYNKDGSLTLFIQRQSPGKSRVSNWLPAPAGVFNLNMRLYWPKQAVLSGQWEPPAVLKQPEFKQLSENRNLK